MPDPIPDLEALERSLARRTDPAVRHAVDDLLIDKAIPSLIARVRELEAALHEACDANEATLRQARRGYIRGHFYEAIGAWRTLAGPRKEGR